MNNNKKKKTMIHIFNTLTSKAPAIRRFPPDGSLSEQHWIRFGNRRFLTRNPFWVRFEERSRDTLQSSTDRRGQGRIICTTGPWTPHTANMSQLPFHIERGRKVLRSPERKQGLADVTRETGRIKEFRLNDALLYSYMYDLRFALLTCLVIGFSIWWMAVPEPLLESPMALCSPDLKMLVNVARDTYVNKVCSTHSLPSPCECGEPLNNAARYILEKDEFDPIHLHPNKTRAVSIYIAAIVLSLALAESVTTEGFRWE